MLHTRLDSRVKLLTIFAGSALAAVVALKGSAPESEQIYILTEQSDGRTSPYRFHSIGTIPGARTLAVPETGANLLVLTEGGRVWAWGNESGKPGNRGTLSRYGWAEVDGLEEVAAVAAGALHSVALKRDGTVWTWGWNDQGQLGDGTLVNRFLPGAVPGLSDVRMIAAGGAFTLALRLDGTVWACGANWTEIVPGEVRRSLLQPLQVGGLSGIEAIGVYRNRGYAKGTLGQVWIWGKGPAGEAGAPRLLSDSEVAALAAPVARQLGLIDLRAASASEWSGASQRNRTVHVGGSSLEVLEGATENRFAFEGRVVDVNWGWAVALITAPAGSASAPASEEGPAAAAKLPASSTAAGSHTLFQSSAIVKTAALASDPPLSPWGRRLTAGGNQSLAVKADGTLWGWGINDVGQLCDGTTTQRLTPVQSAITGITQVSTSTVTSGAAPHTLMLAADRSVWGCGSNGYGQLGDGTTVDKSTPVQIPGLTGVLAVGTGQFHSIALKSDGTVWGWGYNGNGQVGDGTKTERLSPVQVASLTGVVAIAGGYAHNVALKSDGTVWTWGYNGWGQLGTGTTNDSATPVQVPSLTGVVAIAAGEDHTLVLKSDGTVWSWGDGHLGQLGNGSFSFN